MKYTPDTYIEKAIEKYGKDRFSFDKTNYIDSYHKIIVTCNKHNIDFLVSPITFIRPSHKGNFCPDCQKNKKILPEEFIQLVNILHPELDCSKTKYVNTRNMVTVTCSLHGDFSIKAKNLINENTIQVCPDCKDTAFNYVKKYTKNKELGSEEGVFYKLLVTYIPLNIKFIKIGISSKSTYTRYNNSGYKEFKFEIIEEIIDTNLGVALIEQKYKQDNKSFRFYLPKEITFVGRSECYIFDEIQELKQKQVKLIRDSLLIKQKNICPLCKEYVKMPTLDHYHSKKHNGSGLVRGVLCNNCNRFLGMIENNLVRNGIDFSNAPNILRNLADYVLNNREPFLHPTEAPKTPKLGKRIFNTLAKEYAIKYPKRKPLVYPPSGKLTKTIQQLFTEFNIENGTK